MKYKCVCGKEFENILSFNGHKSHCNIFFKSKGLENKAIEYQQDRIYKSKQAAEKHKIEKQTQKLVELTKWISEQHICEKCDKVMTEKFGSGRFCSRECANKHDQPKEANQRRSLKAKENGTKPSNCEERSQEAKKRYESNPHCCVICSKKISYSKRSRKTCSPECYSEYNRQKALSRGFGGFAMRNKGLTYKGVKLDSTYELKVAKSLTASKVNWSRGPRFQYIYQDKVHHYTPDFYLPDYNIYLDPKNDFLINNINPNLGYSDEYKIELVMKQNNIKVLILNKDQLQWKIIKNLIRNAG